jgi:mono/diheme cytochrome c family protein
LAPITDLQVCCRRLGKILVQRITSMTKDMTKSLIAGMTVAMLLAPVSVLAQEADNVGHGRQIAQTICVECHVVARDQKVSPNSEAPPFPMIAATPGMTSIALTAALLTSHRRMPNIMLEADERRDIIAYILSLK